MNDELLNIATKTMENFDPAKDKVDDFEEIADGKYTCLLEKVTYKRSEKGTDWISLDFSITEENENRHIFVPYFFSEKMIQRSIKAITKLAYDFGYTLGTDAFTSFNTLAESLDAMSGNQAIVEKKTANSGFTNYKVTPLQI